MMNLFDFCSIHWIFPWLLPFLLGLGLGWLFWGKYKSISANLEGQISGLNNTISGLETDLQLCKNSKSEADGNIALLRGRMREMEASMSGTTGAQALTLQATKAAAESGSGDKWFAAIGTDKLQIIEGIGPKMEEVLRENNIPDFYTLATCDTAKLRDILNKYGDKYRIIDPATWPQQAKMASNRKWNDLIMLQKTLDTGRSETATDGETDSKLEKWLIKAGILRRWKQDDLKVVEGIGPKIEELLHQAGINTWRSLAETSIEKIQEILTAAGPRYSLAVPATWPQQAALAAGGKWDELQVFQDALNAGKEK